MICLTQDEILIIHKQLICHYGGIHGLRDEALLNSALCSPYQGFGKYELYPTTIEKAVRLCFNLVKNHPFIDGNKRIATMVLLVTLDLNNITFKANHIELTNIILKLAAGKINYHFLLQWVKNRVYS